MTQPQSRWSGFVVLCLLAPACQREAEQGGGPLPPADTSLNVRDSIANPFEEIAPGVFSRVLYRTPATAGPTVEVRDLELARGKAVASLRFPGAAIIEVRSGNGSLRRAAKPEQIRAGGAFGLSQGDSLQLANQDSGPMSLRVYVIGSR
jgi:hypothetical protein